MKNKCKTCGKEFKRKLSQIKRAKLSFCSPTGKFYVKAITDELISCGKKRSKFSPCAGIKIQA